MYKNKNVDLEFLSVIEKKYNVIHCFGINNHDKDFKFLRQELLALKKETFAPEDRIIVIQFDTDYYIDCNNRA